MFPPEMLQSVRPCRPYMKARREGAALLVTGDEREVSPPRALITHEAEIVLVPLGHMAHRDRGIALSHHLELAHGALPQHGWTMDHFKLFHKGGRSGISHVA